MNTSTNPTKPVHTRTLLATLFITVILFATSAAFASPKTVRIVPPNATYHGKTYAQWSAQAVRFSVELPLAGHPALDPDPDVRAGQKGEVWFLGGPFGTYERFVTVPAGKALFLVLLNTECSSLETPESGFHGDTEAEQRECAQYWTDHIVDPFFTINGDAVDNIGDFRVSSPQFAFTAPTPWLFGATGGTGTSVADGYYVMLDRLPKGEHTIHFGGSFHFTLAEDGFDGDLPVDMTYHVTVK